MSFIAKCIDGCEDAARLAKALLAFFIGSFAVALAFQAKRDVNDMMRMITKHTGIVAFLSNIFTIGFGFMYIVNVGCVLYTLLGLHCIRTCIFRERVNETTKCRVIQCCLGPCCATYQQAMVCVTLGIQIGLSYCYLLMGVFLGFLLGMCHGGHAVISSFQGLLDDYHARNSFQAGSFSPVNWLMGINVEKYCDATRGMDEAAMQCFTGCLLSVLSQSIMLMVISEEKGRIEGTMADAGMMLVGDSTSKQPRGKRRRGDSSSSSSSSGSDSDNATKPYDPLAKYKHDAPKYPVYGSYPGGARTYH
jgi:hypothetical protein